MSAPRRMAASAALACGWLLAALPCAALPAFGPEVRLSAIAGPSIEPKLAAGSAADDVLHAVWSEFAAGGTQQILYSRSTNNGDSWSVPVPLSTAPAPPNAVIPTIAANGGKVVVTWTDTIVGGDLYYRISTDGGATWNTPPAALYPAAGYSRPSGTLVDGAGRIHIAWFDSRATGYGQTYHAVSCDNGGTWSPLQRVNQHDGGVDNESPRLAEGADGTVYMLYRASRDGNPQRGWPPFDHYLLRSTAVGCGGVTWLYPSQRVSRGLPEDLGNTYGGQIFPGRDGRMHVGWWSETRGNNLVYRGGYPKPLAGQPRVPGFGRPVEASGFGPNHLEFDLNTAETGGFGLGEDASGVVHAVFAENDHMKDGFQVGSIWYARSADGGASFEPRQPVTTGADAMAAHGIYHNGRFHMIWADFRDGNQGAEIYYRNVSAASAPALPGSATVVGSPYGPLSVSGGTLSGTTITAFSSNAIITLGSAAGRPGQFAQIDFMGLNIGAGNTLSIRSGAPGQKAVLVNADGAASVIGGALKAIGGAGASPPELYVHNANGVTVVAGGSVMAPAGLTVDTLGATTLVGAPLTNAGVIDGGSSLRLLGARITGGGSYKGNAVLLSTFGNANNPVNGSRFLLNGLQLSPSTGGEVALTLNGYGTSPQVFNVAVTGNASVWMPTAWPAGDPTPRNNPPVPQGGTRPAGTPEPAYGGGSMIVQATGAMTLVRNGANDFAFPGAIALKAGGTLNVNDVLVNQGWTTTGKAFQGVFLESPNIVGGTAPISVLSNNLNWVNFSTLPHGPVRTWQLALQPDGSAQYVAADATAPHLNTYSVIQEAAAAGACWVCLVNTTPVDMR